MQNSHKFDLFYEFRPYLFAVIGVIGIFQRHPGLDVSWIMMSQLCGLTLIFCSSLIIYWRWSYRRLRA